MSKVVCTERSGSHLDESLSIFRRPCLGSLTIFTQFVLHEVVRRINTYSLERVRTQFESHLTSHVTLRRCEHCLDIRHYRFEILTLVQEHAVPVAHLVFPVLLPLRQGVLLKESVCTNDEHRSCSLETYTTLDADDGITYVTVATYGVCGTNLFDSLNSLDLIVVLLSVYTTEFALLETKFQKCWFVLCRVLQICRLRQSLGRVQNLTTTNRRTPYTYVVRILQFGDCLEQIYAPMTMKAIRIISMLSVVPLEMHLSVES